MTVTVYSKNGSKILKQESGYGTVTINLSDLSVMDKDGCYVQIVHSRHNYQDNYRAGRWEDYPPAPAISTTTTLGKIEVIY